MNIQIIWNNQGFFLHFLQEVEMAQSSYYFLHFFTKARCCSAGSTMTFPTSSSPIRGALCPRPLAICTSLKWRPRMLGIILALCQARPSARVFSACPYLWFHKSRVSLFTLCCLKKQCHSRSCNAADLGIWNHFRTMLVSVVLRPFCVLKKK